MPPISLAHRLGFIAGHMRGAARMAQAEGRSDLADALTEASEVVEAQAGRLRLERHHAECGDAPLVYPDGRPVVDPR